MNIKDSVNQLNFIRRNPKKSIVGFIFFTAVILYISFLSKVPEYFTIFLKNEPWSTQKIVVGKSWNIEVLGERLDRFSVKLLKLNKNMAEIEISSPKIGMYRLETMTITKSFIHTFQSGKYFYRFTIKSINPVQDFIVVEIYRIEQST